MMSAIIPMSKKELADDAQSCVYVLYHLDSVVYVGQSVNLQGRLLGHKSDRKAFDSFSFVSVDVLLLDQVEASTIVKLNPSMNKSLPNNSGFTSSQRVIKNVNSAISNRIRDNAVFIGMERTKKTGSLIYVEDDFALALLEYIDSFEYKSGAK